MLPTDQEVNWLVCSPLSDQTVYGKFNSFLFRTLAERGQKVVAYLAEEELRQCDNHFDARFVSNEIFCSELELENYVRGNRNAKIISHVDRFLNDSFLVKTYLRISDRMMVVPQSAGTRFVLLRLTIEFWAILINEFKINSIWFPATPHFGFDTVLALMAEKLSINVFIVNRTEYDGVYIVSNRIFPRSYLERTSALKLNLKPKWIEYSRKLSADAVMHNQRIDKSTSYKFRSAINLTRLMIRLISVMISNKNWFRRYSPLYMTSYRAFVFLPSIIFRYSQSRRLWISYKNASCDQIPNPYIYFPWSFQPERTTDPEAGKFSDLEFCVHYLMAELPREFTLVIKEHPRQFDTAAVDLRKMHARHSQLYKRISQIERVVIADINLDSERLVRESAACVTTTGSIGVEVLEMGKSIGCFGTPWYAGLNGCYRIDTKRNLKIFFKCIQSKSNKVLTTELAVRMQQYLSNHFFQMPNKSTTLESFTWEEIKQMAEQLASAVQEKKYSSLTEKF